MSVDVIDQLEAGKKPRTKYKELYLQVKKENEALRAFLADMEADLTEGFWTKLKRVLFE